MVVIIYSPQMSPLTDLERKITLSVVDGFMKTRGPTLKTSLLWEFEDSSAVFNLERNRILAGDTNEVAKQGFLPTALAFNYCGDLVFLNLARKAVTDVARILRHMFKARLEGAVTPAEITAYAGRFDLPLDADHLWLGLYLIPAFPHVIKGFAGQIEKTSVTINEYIVEIKNLDSFWDDYIRDAGQVVTDASSVALNVNTLDVVTPNSLDVFVVHGHDAAAMHSVARFLQTLGLNPIILHEQANKGRTVIEKFVAHSEDAAFAVVLLTPDDVGGETSNDLKQRARQNVILELGYFLGKLGRPRVCALYWKALKFRPTFMGSSTCRTTTVADGD